MSEVLVRGDAASAVPIVLLEEGEVSGWLASASEAARAAAGQGEFKGHEDKLLALVGGDGRVERVLLGAGKAAGPMALRGAPSRLPPGDYRLERAPDACDPEALALGWAMGSYVFDRYKDSLRKPKPRLVVSAGVDLDGLLQAQHALALCRDMINTPAADMGARQIEAIAREVAEQFGAAIAVTEGEALREGYPAVHAVGRAAAPDRQPRFVELTWGDPAAPRVVLIGKGVVFDTGGLDIKSAAGMRIMKKDMGGAAHALALGRMVMAAGLPVRLSVLLPIAENAISGDAVRPGDVIVTRKGLTVEVGNTDAEGRLLLADALTRASELEPELTVDFATLTGAARVALGPDLPPLFTDDDALADAVLSATREVGDPLWRMPLWDGYEPALEGDIADLRNDPADWAQAGAVTAALFLRRFAPATGSWAHVDLMAWNPRARPGWPLGGEAMTIRAMLRMLQTRYPRA